VTPLKRMSTWISSKTVSTYRHSINEQENPLNLLNLVLRIQSSDIGNNKKSKLSRACVPLSLIITQFVNM
jgi:hypothetical protein